MILGSLAFGFMILFGILSKLLKSQNYKAPLGMGAVRSSVIALFILCTSIAYYAGVARGGAILSGTYTGQEVFNAVNAHRISVGVKPLAIGEHLCDNLVARWRSVKDGKQHEGFEQWVENEQIQSRYGYGEIAELYAQATTPQSAIEFYKSSPGHRIELEASKWTEGCSYASDGWSVTIVSFKN